MSGWFKQLNANYFRDQQGYNSNNYYHELESLVAAEYFKVRFVRSPSSTEGNQSSVDCFKSNKNVYNVLNLDNRVPVHD